MKTSSLISALFLMGVAPLFSQDFTSKLHNPQPGLPEMDLVILPYGMEHPIKLGTIQSDGSMVLEFPGSDVGFLSDEQLEWTFGPLGFAFFFSCHNLDDLGVSTEIKAINGGHLALWYNNNWAGTVYPVSDEKLLPWREDQNYAEPVKASFYEVIYVTENVVIKSDCTNIWNLTNEEVKVAYAFDLDLKKGYNLVEYVIQDIHKTDPKETSSKPNKVEIKSVTEDFSKIIWHAKYF